MFEPNPVFRAALKEKEQEENLNEVESLSQRVERLNTAILLVNHRVNMIVQHLEDNEQLMDELADLNNTMRNR